ncbi:aldo/keto reductase [Fictibacillus sp. B-59209]|uniref:aldo/keto reductase n=1 Tax=Fictibacillus sp. B-59209 TaxID=3024873 RepID=UPI0006A7932B|nr:aldo/keto reductase [Fictibacillus sp. B-59209]MED2973853.1 aldo/keto reductase [Fictibacillus sp. B-59209]
MIHLDEGTVLANGVNMPWVGLGTCKLRHPQAVERAVHAALDAGYRSIDTAAIYQNETEIGNALQKSTVSRELLFITTKLWNASHGYNNTLAAFDESRRKLGVDYIDLYMIHWPVKGQIKETWRALEILYNRGDVRAIGVSNFGVSDLEELIRHCEIKPQVNQVEYHPRLSQKKLMHFCHQNNIQVEAWSPLMQGEILHESLILQIAEKHGKTPAQVVLRWALQNGIPVIPKSATPHRIRQNIDVFDFELPIEDMVNIHFLNENRRIGPDSGLYFYD